MRKWKKAVSWMGKLGDLRFLRGGKDKLHDGVSEEELLSLTLSCSRKKISKGTGAKKKQKK